MGRHALAPSDFIVTPKSLSGRLRDAGIDDQAIEAAQSEVSDMARRFAPASPDERGEAQPEDDGPPEPLRQPSRVIPAPEARPRAKSSPALLIGLAIACAAPSALGGYLIWNGTLPMPFGTGLAAAPAPVAQVDPGQEPMPPKIQGRMEAAVSALSDPATKSSVQEKTVAAPSAAVIPPAEAAPAPAQLAVTPAKIEVEPSKNVRAAEETDFTVSVDQASALASGNRIVVAGLPKGATFSAGQQGPEGWMLAPDDLSGLTLTLPQDAGGLADIKVALRSQSGEILAETDTSIEIEPSAVLRPDYESRISSMMEQGQKMIDVGYISGARAYYIRAAEAGSAEGAMAAAATFDPGALQALNAHGVKPDVEQARRWYERAILLGATGAQAKLNELPTN